MVRNELKNGLLMKGMAAGSKCFPAGTLVVTENGSRQIEGLQIGDTVVATCLETGARYPATVERVDVDLEKTLLRIEFEGGDALVTTPTQRLLSGSDWLLSRKVRPGSRIGDRLVIDIKPQPWGQEVYTLVIAPYNNYVVLTKERAEVVCHDNSSDLGESDDVGARENGSSVIAKLAPSTHR